MQPNYAAPGPLLCAVTIIALMCGSTSDVRASCAGQRARVVWSYPAEGDREVPLDAEIRVLATTALSKLYQATLNGTLVSPSAEGAYSADELDPDTDYTFRIVGPTTGSSELPTLFELRFHTGTERAPEIDAPQLLDSTREPKAPALDPLCEDAYLAGECFDTPRYTYDRLELGQQDAVAWLVSARGAQAGKLWPSACSPVLTLHERQHGEPLLCFDLYAVGANGAISEPKQYCPPVVIERKALGQQAGSDERASQHASSCAIATLGRAGGQGAWASALWLGAYLYLRRRRRSQLRAASRGLAFGVGAPEHPTPPRL